MNYRQRMAAAWPDERLDPRQPAATAAKAKPAAPAQDAPPFRELAQARSAAAHAKDLLNAAWPDEMQLAGAQGQDDVDPDQARAQELAEIEQDLAVLNRRKERILKTGQS